MSINTSQTIVIDNGSGILKAGLANEKIPQCILQNRVARPKVNDLKKESFIGQIDDLSKLSINYPMQHGVITDWDDMEKIWQHMYNKQLSLYPEEHPVLFTEAPLNPRTNREKIIEIFFETFNVPAMYISIQAVLTLYSTGRTTGVVLDSGDGVTSAVPVYQGFAMPESIKRIDFAGREVTQYLQMLLKKEGINFHTSADFEIIRKIKEDVCYIGENPIREENNARETLSYKLPDGKTIEIGPSRFRAPEVLFRPDFLGREYNGLHEILCQSIEESDLDMRSTLFKNIVLSGGSTLFKGFGHRLISELKSICPKMAQLKIAAPKERMYSVWIGGSVLASLGIFQDKLVSKQLYEEKGTQAFQTSNVLLDSHYSSFIKHTCVQI